MKNRLTWALCLVMVAIAIPTTVSAQDSQDELIRERQTRLDPDNADSPALLRESSQREADDARALLRSQDNFNNAQNLATSPRWRGGNQDTFPQRETIDPRNLATARGFFANRTDPKLAEAYNKANSQLTELVQKIKTAESEEVKLELKAEVKLLLEEKYEAYLEHHEAPLIQLEERLAKLREDFDSRKKAKDDLVKLRLDTIWYDAIGLGWPENQRNSGAFGLNLNNRTFSVAPDSRSPFMLNAEAGNVPGTRFYRPRDPQEPEQPIRPADAPISDRLQDESDNR